MKPRINAHCHLLNFDFVPAAMINVFTPRAVVKLVSLLTGGNTIEEIAKKKTVRKIAALVAKVSPGKRFDEIETFLRNFSSFFDDVADSFHDATTTAGIDIYTPLTMNLDTMDVSKDRCHLTFHTQVNAVSRFAAQHPWQVFPFVMFDPRVSGSDEFCIRALKEKGFLGVKMYPALGYHPDPERVRKRRVGGRGTKPSGMAADRLMRLYEFCEKEKIPITVHTSTGGAYSAKVTGSRKDAAWYLTNVSNWRGVLQKYALKVNFAHMGGNYLCKKTTYRERSIMWRRQILKLIRQNKNEEHHYRGKVFADLSFHDMAFTNRRDYFYRSSTKPDRMGLRQLLDDPRYNGRILFGTDSPMISHTYSEGKFIKRFTSNLKKTHIDLLFSENPIEFLFDNRRIPERYVDFLRSRNPSALDDVSDFPWICKSADRGYYIDR